MILYFVVECLNSEEIISVPAIAGLIRGPTGSPSIFTLFLFGIDENRFRWSRVFVATKENEDRLGKIAHLSLTLRVWDPCPLILIRPISKFRGIKGTVRQLLRFRKNISAASAWSLYSPILAVFVRSDANVRDDSGIVVASETVTHFAMQSAENKMRALQVAQRFKLQIQIQSRNSHLTHIHPRGYQ